MVANSLQTQTKSDVQKMTYTCNGEEITLTPALVKNYLISGDASNVTMEEIVTFMSLCRFQKLNPWVKEAYCIKYGNQPATLVVSKEAFQKRAEVNPSYDGMDSGIIVYDGNEFHYRRGTLKLPNEEIIGGWAEVFRKDRSHSTRVEVSFDEYAGRKKDGTLNNQWASKPATMIRKVAVAQALREAFPANLGGMFTAEEQAVAEPMPVNITVDAVVEPSATVEAETEPTPEENAQLAFFEN